MQETPQSHSGPQPSRNQPARFVDHMQQLFGEEPDPIFLEDSWTVGVPAAIERLQRRRDRREVYLSQTEAFGEETAIRELERLAGLADERPAEIDVESFLRDRSQPVDARYSPAWLSRIGPELQTEENASTTNAANRTYVRTPEFSMSTARATELLDVTPCATREDIRSAYRRRVIQCHPDHCQHATEAVRRHATQQVADLNEAYRVLCDGLLNQLA